MIWLLVICTQDLFVDIALVRNCCRLFSYIGLQIFFRFLSQTSFIHSYINCGLKTRQLLSCRDRKMINIVETMLPIVSIPYIFTTTRPMLICRQVLFNIIIVIFAKSEFFYLTCLVHFWHTLCMSDFFACI